MDRKEEILKILGSQTLGAKSGDKSVNAQALWEVVEKADSREEKVELLEAIFTKWGKAPKNAYVLKNAGIGSDNWDELNRKLTGIVTDYSRNTFFTTKNSHEFATEILRFLDFFPPENEKIFCLATILYASDIIPYHNLPGDTIRISDEEHRALLLANTEKAELIRYLVSLPFFSWNEAASQVLQVVDSVEDKKLRIALLSYFMIAKIKTKIAESESKER
jgi:hypothetical protein